MFSKYFYHMNKGGLSAAQLKLKSFPSADIGITQTFRLNKTVDDRKTDRSPVVDQQVLSYDVVNATKFKYRIASDLEKKSVLSNSALMCGLTFTPQSLNSESTIVKLAHNSRLGPHSGKMESTESVKAGFSLLDGVNLWNSVSDALIML
jgi:hypothetical protein